MSAKLERAEVVTGAASRSGATCAPLPVQAACLQCHGQADKLGPGVAARLSELYPRTRAPATCWARSRGAMTLRQNVQ